MLRKERQLKEGKCRQTYDVNEAAHLLGIATKTAWGEIHRTGTLAGIRVIRAGNQRVLVPRLALDQALAGNPKEGGELSNGN